MSKTQGNSQHRLDESSASERDDVVDQLFDGKLNLKGNPNKMLARFNPNPSKHIQRKIEYFILPYNQRISSDKHMKFEEERHVEFDLSILKKEQPSVHERQEPS